MPRTARSVLKVVPILGLGMRRAVENTSQGGLKIKSSMAWTKRRTKAVPVSNKERVEVIIPVIYDIVSGKVHLAKRVTISAISQAKCDLVYDFSVLGTIDPEQDYMMKYRLRVANWAIETK